MAEPEPGYFLDHYGECLKTRTEVQAPTATNRLMVSACDCLKPGRDWLGQECLYWRPLGATDWASLQRKIMGAQG